MSLVAMDTHEGTHVDRVSWSAPHPSGGTYTSHGPALPPMGYGGESPAAWFENRRFSSSRKSDALSNDNGAQRREQPGPWRWREVAVTAHTPAKRGASPRLFPPAAALWEFSDLWLC